MLSIPGVVKLCFVIPASCHNENDVDDEMKMAFQECTEVDLNPKWLNENECFNISYTKTDVFILQTFMGEIFNKLRNTKSIVCGPVCLRTCLREGSKIPVTNSPVFTTAMRDLSITVSNTTTQNKMKIKEKVGFMGGIYTSNLTESTTHLVSNAVRSSKYEKATENGFPVMTEEWITAVWEASLKRNIKATDPEFIKYRCKIFQGLQITCSNLSKIQKENMKKLINENGGIFSPQLSQNATALLIISEPRGEKYKYAVSWKLPCVYPSWIIESVEKGYALPTKNHLIKSEMKCSTPTSNDVQNFTLDVNDQFSIISHEGNKSNIDETVMSNISAFSGKHTQKQLEPPNSQGIKYKQILESLNLTIAKRAGHFLDGCKVFLSGFTSQEIERVRRLLIAGGATIFNELSETVTYVIVGDNVVSDVKAISNMQRRPYVVSMEWLSASIKQKGIASGDLYSCMEQMNIPCEPPSPLSQKGLQLLQPVDINNSRSSSSVSAQTPQPVKRKLLKDFAKPDEGHITETTNHEKVNNSFSQNRSSQAEISDEVIEFFKDITFKIEIPNEEEQKCVVDIILTYGGIVKGPRFKGVTDYLIVPVIGEIGHVTATEIATYLWVEECLENEECVPIEYYHQPFTLHSTKKPLKDCCLVTSNCTGKEKAFLTLLGEALGARCQDVFARKNKLQASVMASTHLITSSPFGNKFEAAQKWKIPVVGKDWLFACAKSGLKVPEETYIVTVDHNNDVNVTPNTHQTSKENLMGPPCLEPIVGIPNNPSSYQSPVVLPNKKESPVDIPDCFRSEMGPPQTSRILNYSQSPADSNNAAGCSDWPRNLAQSPIESPNVERTLIGARNSNSVIKETPSKRKSVRTSEYDSEVSVSPFHINTPNSPYGQPFGTPTKSIKKRWKKMINNMEKFANDESPPLNIRRDSTPYIELRSRMRKYITDPAFEYNSPTDNEQNVEMTSPQFEIGKENCEPVLNNSSQLNRFDEGMSLSKKQKLQSTSTISKTPLVQSNGTTNDHLIPRVDLPGTGTDNRSSAENSLKRHMVLNERPGNNSPLNPVTKKQIPKVGLIDSEPIAIGWLDPVEAAAKEIIKVTSLKKNKKRTKLQELKTKQRKFTMSNDLKFPNQYAQIITDLGGEVLINQAFDKSVTHMIVESPTRSEKFLCCIAAGVWILHTNYLVECKRQNKWLPEEDYECGNPRSVNNIPQDSLNIVEAAFRWRNTLKGGKGAYSGMKIAIMNISQNKKTSYERLILAGGGEVVEESHFLEATHCCMEPWKSVMPDYVKEFVKNKIPCFRPIFLGEYLYTDPIPSIEDFILPKLKDLY